MIYEEAMEFINITNKLGSVLGLESIAALLNRLGNPQERIKIIHVAGSNGKGSTIAFLSRILAASGYKVGMYISPVVFSYNEKLQIISMEGDKCNTEYISEENICKSLELIKLACEDMIDNGLDHPTSFEIETAMAFLYMEWEEVDFLILETGMGGRLDATNVIDSPICSVITAVSLDHMQFLGDTLEQIAYEKAGIIKPNSSLIISNQQPEAIRVFSSRAKELNIPMILADMNKAKDISYKEGYTTFLYPYQDNLDSYKIHLLGKHQVQNAILAIETARRIRNLGYSVSEEAIKVGLWLAKWQGRFEQISEEPAIYIDGAHNAQAAQSLRESIEIYFTNRRIIFIIGVLADKDYQSMLSILASLADTIITLTPDNPRALSSTLLAKEASFYCSKVFDEKDVEHALDRAYEEAHSSDVIIAFGSLSFLGRLVRGLLNPHLDLEG